MDQPTGYKDKNGQDIKYGDICRRVAGEILYEFYVDETYDFWKEFLHPNVEVVGNYKNRPSRYEGTN